MDQIGVADLTTRKEKTSPKHRKDNRVMENETPFEKRVVRNFAELADKRVHLHVRFRDGQEKTADLMKQVQ